MEANLITATQHRHHELRLRVRHAIRFAAAVVLLFAAASMRMIPSDDPLVPWLSWATAALIALIIIALLGLEVCESVARRGSTTLDGDPYHRRRYLRMRIRDGLVLTGVVAALIIGQILWAAPNNELLGQWVPWGALLIALAVVSLIGLEVWEGVDRRRAETRSGPQQRHPDFSLRAELRLFFGAAGISVFVGVVVILGFIPEDDFWTQLATWLTVLTALLSVAWMGMVVWDIVERRRASSAHPIESHVGPR